MSGMLASIDFDPESALRTFQNSFSKILKDNNIQLSEPASLQCGTDGHIYVTNNTLEKEKIEELFKNNHTFSTKIVRMCFLCLFIRAKTVLLM